MPRQRAGQILVALTALTTLAACGTYGHHVRDQPDPGYSSTGAADWDSAPLDRDYQHQRADMEDRHSRESAAPRDGESADQRSARHASESKDLENRYAQGKAAHATSLPPSERGHDDTSH